MATSILELLQCAEVNLIDNAPVQRGVSHAVGAAQLRAAVRLLDAGYPIDTITDDLNFTYIGDDVEIPEYVAEPAPATTTLSASDAAPSLPPVPAGDLSKFIDYWTTKWLSESAVSDDVGTTVEHIANALYGLIAERYDVAVGGK